MRERTFAGLTDARRIFDSRVVAAKKALAKDLETIESTNTKENGNPARSVQMAAVQVYERAVLAAFYEYLDATSVVVPDDEQERMRFAERDLERRRVELEEREARHGRGAGGAGVRGGSV